MRRSRIACAQRVLLARRVAFARARSRPRTVCAPLRRRAAPRAPPPSPCAASPPGVASPRGQQQTPALARGENLDAVDQIRFARRRSTSRRHARERVCGSPGSATTQAEFVGADARRADRRGRASRGEPLADPGGQRFARPRRRERRRSRRTCRSRRRRRANAVAALRAPRSDRRSRGRTSRGWAGRSRRRNRRARTDRPAIGAAASTSTAATTR